MKIKDLLKFSVFRGADFVDYKTHETIIDQEKEIEDIHSIQINEEVKCMGFEHNEHKYFALHRWLTVYLILKDEKSLDALKELRDYYEEGTK